MRITRTDLLLLALLDDGPMCAWDLDSTLESAGAGLWVEYSRPHLYYALRKLAREGYVEVLPSPEKSAKRPYRITDQGRQMLSEDEIVAELAFESTRFDFDLLLGFAEKFGLGKSLPELIRKRRESLEEELASIQELWREAEISGALQFGRLAVIKHRIRFLKSELEFLKWLEKNAPADWQSSTDSPLA
jgi:DNA-binding PadR family transcriptional regulator